MLHWLETLRRPKRFRARRLDCLPKRGSTHVHASGGGPGDTCGGSAKPLQRGCLWLDGNCGTWCRLPQSCASPVVDAACLTPGIIDGARHQPRSSNFQFEGAAGFRRERYPTASSSIGPTISTAALAPMTGLTECHPSERFISSSACRCRRIMRWQSDQGGKSPLASTDGLCGPAPRSGR
jgi:hypothetical protein